jgi:antirestriction protein ArdC
VGGHTSHYNPSEDHIRIPDRSQFLGDERYYATVIHEMAHSTAKECKRSFSGPFGSDGYALEEFVAELSAACVCSMLGIGKLLDENHVAYVQNWRKALREDKDVIPKVIDHVQSCTNYILTRYEAVRKELNPLALPMAA